MAAADGDDDVPLAFCCPIGLDMMKDPVFLVAVSIFASLLLPPRVPRRWRQMDPR